MRRGFTLLELCLASTLSLLLGFIMIRTLIPVMRYASWGYGRAEVMQATVLIASRLVSDLQTAPFEAITLPTPGPQSQLGIHAIAGVTNTGQAVWADHLVLYQYNQASGALSCLQWTQGVTLDAPQRLTSPQIQNCFQHPNASLRRLSQGILKEFSLSGTHLPLKLHLLVQVQVSGGRAPERYAHDQEIYLRNGTR